MKKKKCEEWEESRESQIVKENHVEKKVTCLRTNKIDRMIERVRTIRGSGGQCR